MARKKGGGGKLNRNEIVYARLDSNLYMAAEIMSRSERRTLSSFIERSIEQEAKRYKVKRNLFFPWWSENPDLYCRDKIYSLSDSVTVDRAIQDIGAHHEAIRFIKFGAYFPELLTKHEEEMFAKVTFTKYFWMHYPVNMEDKNGKILYTEWIQTDAIEGLVKENLFEYWERIKSDQISIEILGELPIGKKIPAPLAEDPRAIKKYIKTGDPKKPYKIVFVKDETATVPIEGTEDKEFLEKNFKNLIARNIELKKIEDGSQIIATFHLPENKQNTWIEFINKKMEEQSNGD